MSLRSPSPPSPQHITRSENNGFGPSLTFCFTDLCARSQKEAVQSCERMVLGAVAERSSALDSSSGVVRMWVRIQAWPVAALVSLSKALNHNCFVLWMGRKAVGPVCCVMHVKEPRTLIVKEKGACPVFLDSRLLYFYYLYLTRTLLVVNVHCVLYNVCPPCAIALRGSIQWIRPSLV